MGEGEGAVKLPVGVWTFVLPRNWPEERQGSCLAGKFLTECGSAQRALSLCVGSLPDVSLRFAQPPLLIARLARLSATGL